MNSQNTIFWLTSKYIRLQSNPSRGRNKFLFTQKHCGEVKTQCMEETVSKVVEENASNIMYGSYLGNIWKECALRGCFCKMIDISAMRQLRELNRIYMRWLWLNIHLRFIWSMVRISHGVKQIESGHSRLCFRGCDLKWLWQTLSSFNWGL